MTNREIEVRMDFNDKCNLRCSMCYFFDGAGSTDMKPEVFARIVEDVLPRTHTAYLSCGAEPFMSRDFVANLERTHGTGVPSIHIVSNGLLLSEKIIRALLDNDVEMLEISLDGATPGTYEAIRIGGRFEKLRANLQNLRGAKESRGTARPELRFRWVLMRQNLHELNELIELAHEFGAVAVGLQHLVMYNPAMSEQTISTDDLRRQCDEAVRAARRKAESYGIEFAAPPDFYPPPPQKEPSSFSGWLRWQLSVGIPRRMFGKRNGAPSGSEPAAQEYRQRCFEPWQKMYIQHSGVVTPCPVWREAPLGNFTGQNFAEIWDGPDYALLRRQLETGDLRETCRTCPIYHSDTRWR